MTLYCGIDLHANNSVISVLDDEDQVHYEKRLPNDLAVIKDSLQPYRNELAACVVESTYNWYWLVDGLMDAGYDVRLAHTGAITQYAGIKHTNDESDARHLAHLLRLGILPEGHIMPKAQRAVRDLLRRRMLLVHQRTLHHLSLQSLIVRHTGERLSANQIKALDPAVLEQKLDDPDVLRWSDHGAGDAVAEQRHRAGGAGSAKAPEGQQGIRAADQHSGGRQDIGLHHCPGDRRHPALSQPGPLRLLCPLRQHREAQQRQAQRSGQQEERQQIPGLGLYGGGALCGDLESGDQAFYQRRKAKRHILVAKKTVANKLAKAGYHMLSRQERFDVHRAFG